MNLPFKKKSDIKAVELQTAQKKLESADLLLKAQTKVLEQIEKMQKVPQALSQDLYSTVFQESGGALNTGWWGFTNDKLRRASRILYWESPDARKIINRLCDLVIGSGLNFQAAPIWDIINSQKYKSLEQRKAWKQKTEYRFHNWAKSKNVDALRERNLYQTMYQLFFYYLRDGEFFVVLRYSPTLNRNPLSLQIIPPENIKGGEPLSGNRCINGIEYNQQDQAVAYHIWDENQQKTIRIAKYGPKSGRLFVLHAYERENEKQRRGIPLMARSMPECTKLADYYQIELHATLINSMIALWVKPPEGQDGRAVFTKTGISPKTSSATTISPFNADWKAKIESMQAKAGAVVVDQLPAGHTIESYDTKRPSSNFNAFVAEFKKNIAASNDIPLSVVDFHFNESYSGARGELLIFWVAVTRRREFFVYDFANPVYSMWFVGDVDNGKIDAPGYYDNPEIKDAWEEITCTGAQRPDIDPLKSVQAHILEQKYGYNTGQRITSERNGGDYDENLEVIKSEFSSIVEALQDFYNISGSKSEKK